jgi:hypothetical protein
MGTPVSPILTTAENGKDKWKLQSFAENEKHWLVLLRAIHADIENGISFLLCSIMISNEGKW